LGRLGHATKLKWNDPSEWIWFQEPVHEPLIGIGAFEQVQALLRARGPATEQSPRCTPRGYALPGTLSYLGLALGMKCGWLAMGAVASQALSGPRAAAISPVPVTRLSAR
jgi:hypothetical protein